MRSLDLQDTDLGRLDVSDPVYECWMLGCDNSSLGDICFP